MRTLFGFIGKLENVQLYPDVPENLESVSPKICFVKFHNPTDVCISLHLTNTVFIDRALLVAPVPDGKVRQPSLYAPMLTLTLYYRLSYNLRLNANVCVTLFAFFSLIVKQNDACFCACIFFIPCF